MKLETANFSKILYSEVKDAWDKHFNGDPMQDDNENGGQEQMEQEAHFFWVLSDFQELVRLYGVEKVMKEMNEDTFWVIEKYLGR